MPFILNDEDYKCEYGTELKHAVLQAKAKANFLLKGYDICLSAHVQPPLPSLSTIIRSAGGNVSSFSLDYLSVVMQRTISQCCLLWFWEMKFSSRFLL